MAFDSVVMVKYDGTSVEAEIHSPITMRIAASVDEVWGPLLRQHSQGDADWRWERLVTEHPEDSHRSFALVCRDRVEALSIVAKERQMRGPPDPTVGSYMEYIASAPWNRRGNSGERLVPNVARVTPAGQILVARAALVSLEEGHAGWLGWPRPRIQLVRVASDMQ